MSGTHPNHPTHGCCDAQPAPAGPVAAAGAPATTLLNVPEMCCAAEFGLVEKELRRLADVVSVTPDFIRRSVSIAHRAVPAGELVAAAARTGFEVRLGSAPPRPMRSIAIQGVAVPVAEAPAPVAADPAPAAVRNAPWPLIAGGVLALGAEVFGVLSGDRSAGAIVLSLAAIGLAGRGTYRKGLLALRRFNLNINALMTVAVTGAACLGQWPEAAMVIVLFALAELIEDQSLDRARRAVEGLMAMAPEQATVQQGSGWREVPASSVRPGATVRVRPGERIALDGQVTAGASAVDQAAITGESVPVDKAVGDALFAGTLNRNGELQYRVTAAAGDSTLARIVRAVQQAQASRAPTQRFVDAFARWYTPAVFATALGVALLPPLLGGAEWATWAYRALVLLVIACPCALVLSTPISVVSGLAAAARRGILIKGGLYLEQGHRLKVLALDKTGTLTRGRPAVTDVIVLDGPEADALRSAAALAWRSDHPVSRAIAEHAGTAAMQAAVEDFSALQGRGVEGRIDGLRHRLGNLRLVRESAASSPELEARIAALQQQGRTAVVLLRERTALAIFAIADSLRPESAEAVARLKRLGIRPVMLSGDNRATADTIARQVGIDDVRSEMLPEGKLQAIEELSAGGAVVGMVGDGINDAPALARAGIGFAMGAAGSDTAIEAADVALMDDDPRRLAEFIELSRATRWVLWQNIGLALGIKAVFLALAVTGQATLWMAVFADMGASLLVVANGLRLLRRS